MRQPEEYAVAHIPGAALLPLMELEARLFDLPADRDEVMALLLEKGIAFAQEQRQIRWFNGEHRTVPIVVMEREDTEIEMTVFEPVHLRQSLPSPIDGRPQRRASLAEVELLVQEPVA